MPALYNEIDQYAVRWLGNLSEAGHIAKGKVDGRSIADLTPDDVRNVTQFHAFAGIGVWSYALRLAGWPDDIPVWTGSCPCQPFSNAGDKRGIDDQRHLFPEWFRLIAECRPPIIFGEQVASPLGREWLSDLRIQMEALGYEVGAADLCAAGAGAPHIRQRLFFVAYSNRDGRLQFPPPRLHEVGPSGNDVARRSPERANGSAVLAAAQGGLSIVGDANGSGLRGDAGAGHLPQEEGGNGAHGIHARAPSSAAWAGLEWLACQDGKSRPTQPGLRPLANGLATRVGRLRAYGNAIVPQIAATFIASVLDVLREQPKEIVVEAKEINFATDEAREAYELAVRSAQGLANYLGEDQWEPVVRENNGWHWRAISKCGRWKLSPNIYEGLPQSFTAFLGEPGRGGVWAANGKTPEDAIAAVTEKALEEITFKAGLLDLVTIDK